MGIDPGKLADLYKQVGPHEYSRILYKDLLGISTDDRGQLCIKDQKLTPGTIGIKELGEAFLGGPEFRRITQRPNGMRGGLAVMEVGEDGGAMVPSQFSNINAWLGTVGGLIDARVLAAYTNQAFIGTELVSLETDARTQEQKRVRYSPPTNDPDEDLLPGQEIPAGNITEEWVKDNKMVKNGQRIVITRETAHFDQTQTVLTSADGVGYQLGERRELRILRPILGIENTYEYKGTASNTYLAAGSYVNEITNEFASPFESAIDLAEQQLLAQTNPATGKPIDVSGERFLITTPFYGLAAQRVARATQYEIGARSASGEVMVTSPTITGLKPRVSQRAFNLMTATSTKYGWTALTSTQANKRWIYGDTKKAFLLREAFPLTTDRFTMTDTADLRRRGVMLEVIADEMSSVTCLEPRYVIRNKKDA